MVESKYVYAKVIDIPDGDDLIIKTRNNKTIDLRLAGVRAKELKEKGGKEALRLLKKLIPIGSTVYYKTVGKSYDRSLAYIKFKGKLFNGPYNELLKKKGLYGGN